MLDDNTFSFEHCGAYTGGETFNFPKFEPPIGFATSKPEKRPTISAGNVKLGQIPNISLTPGESCGNAKLCLKDCYAKKAYAMYPSVKNAWDKNLELALNDRVAYFNGILPQLQELKNLEFFRWHVSGDILDSAYLYGMCWLADQMPETKFLAFTKMYKVVGNFLFDIPENLTIVLSVWPGLEFTNERNLQLAFCNDGTDERYIKYNAVDCPGYCENCGLCWSLPKLGVNVVFNKH